MSNRGRHVIAGNGAAAIAAAEALRALDGRSSLQILSAEPGPAYSKVLLHYLVAGEIDEGTMNIRDAAFYREIDAELVHGEVEGVDVDSRRVHLAGGAAVPYDTLLLATGASAWKPPIPGIDLPSVLCLWTLEDARALLSLAGRCRSAVVVGAGFVGLQATHALEARGAHVTLVDVVDRVLPLMLDAEGGALVGEHLRGRGVALWLGVTVAGIAPAAGGLKRLDLSDASSLEADVVVVATGARPNVAFLAGSPIRVERGVVVDDRMETNVPDVYAAGDVAISRDAVTGRPVNCAIWPVAVEQGRVAGRNMAGGDARYDGALRVNVTDAVGLLVGSVGLTEEGDGVRSEVFRDARRRDYRRLFFRGNTLVGAMEVGDTSDLGVLSSLIRRGVDVSPWRDRLVTRPLAYGQVFSALGVQQSYPSSHLP